LALGAEIVELNLILIPPGRGLINVVVLSSLILSYPTLGN